MNITRKDVDAVNAVLTVQIAKADYAEKVEKKESSKTKMKVEMLRSIVSSKTLKKLLEFLQKNYKKNIAVVFID